jgi:hypothetical protein
MFLLVCSLPHPLVQIAMLPPHAMAREHVIHLGFVCVKLMRMEATVLVWIWREEREGQRRRNERQLLIIYLYYYYYFKIGSSSSEWIWFSNGITCYV